MTKPRSFAVAAIAIPVALAAGCSTTDLAHSKAASPQKNEIPVVLLPQIPDNATPKTGSVVEYWPDGRKKSDRQYKDGRMLRAIFYSSDGKKVYEMKETVGGQ